MIEANVEFVDQDVNSENTNDLSTYFQSKIIIRSAEVKNTYFLFSSALVGTARLSPFFLQAWLASNCVMGVLIL